MSSLKHCYRSRTSKRSRTTWLRLEELEDRVVLSAATHLVATTEPPASITAGAGFGLTISAEDATNAVDTTFTGPITIALTGTGPLNGTLTVNAVAGVAVFSALTINKSGVGDTITATDAPLTPGTTTAFTVVAAAATQLAVTTEPPASITAGSAFGMAVSAEDQFSNVDTTFTGPITAALTGPGVLSGTLTVNAVAGVATFAGLSINLPGVGDSIAVTDAPLVPATTTTFNVIAAAATQLAFTPEPPASITAGAPFGLTVSAENANGTVDTSFTGPVTIALTGTGPLNGTLTVNAVAGVATFSGLTINKSGVGDSITATDSPLIPATTTTFAVVAAAATQLLVTAEPPASITAGTSFGLTVTAEDPFGNVDATFTGPVTAALTGTGPLNGTLTVNAVAGVATFSGLSINKAGTGDTIAATSIPLAPAVTNSFSVVAAAATQLVVTGQPPASITAGAPFGLTVTAEDAFGNVDTTFTGPITAALTGTGPLNGTLTVNAVAGVATFAGLTINKSGTGDSITVTDAPLTPATTTTFSVVAAAATKLVITSQPPASVLVGAGFGLTVSAEDQFGNVDPTFTSAVTVSLNGVGTLGGTLTVNAVAGVAAFTGLTVSQAGTGDTITATGTTLTPATSTAFAVVTLPSISGALFLDLNATGTFAAGDTGLLGRTVYIDLHGDGVLHPDDPQSITDSFGNFTFNGLAPGTYTLRVVTFPGDTVTNPGGSLSVTLIMGANATGENLGLLLGSTILPNTPNAHPFAGATTAIEASITGLYHYILGRNPDASGLAFWVSQAAHGESITAIATQFYNSTEYETNTVKSYYQTFLGRSGDPSGVAFWVSQLDAHVSEQTVVESFLSSAEYTADHASNDSFVSSLYANVLGRNAVASELSAWDSALGAGLSRTDVVADIVQSTESYTRSINGDYTILLARTADTAGANFWLTNARNGDSQVSIAARILGSSEYSQRAANSIA
jgi:hypothetical protein